MFSVLRLQLLAQAMNLTRNGRKVVHCQHPKCLLT
jgi:hypothetical protein